MRKWVVVACCLLVGAAGAAAGQVPGIEYQDGWVPAERPVDMRIMGDVTGDGQVTIQDVVALANIADGLIDAEAWQILVGDLNGDGRITRADAALLLAQVDPKGRHFSIRFLVGEEPDGEIVTSARDVLEELRNGEELRALHIGDVSAYFDLLSQGCLDCNVGNCNTTFRRNPFASIRVKSDIVGTVCSAVANEVSTINATHVSFNQEWPSFPLKPGDNATIIERVDLITCSTFAAYFTVNGVHCVLPEVCNASNTDCITP